MDALLDLFTGGFDWHDTKQTHEYIKRDGSYGLKDVDRAIAEVVYDSAMTMMVATRNQDGSVKEERRLEIPKTFTMEYVLDAVRNNKTITLQSTEEYLGTDADGDPVSVHEMEFEYDGKQKVLRTSCGYGQFTCSDDFIKEQIPDDKVGYIAVENFTAPMKGCPSVCRFYHEPYTDLAEAERALEEMQLHEGISAYGSQKELFVVNMDEIKDNEWYKNNVAAFGKEFKLFFDMTPEDKRAELASLEKDLIDDLNSIQDGSDQSPMSFDDIEEALPFN